MKALRKPKNGLWNWAEPNLNPPDEMITMRAVIADIPQRWLDEHRASEVSQWDEMWNGELHMAAVPHRKLQDLAFHLQMYLFNHWQLDSGGRVNQEVNLTTLEDEDDWKNNYRIPDLVILDSDRLHIDRGTYMAGAPLVCVEIFSPGDESYEKLGLYAQLGVPEVWIIHRDSKRTEIFQFADGEYRLSEADANGWVKSACVPVTMKPDTQGKLLIRMNNDPQSLAAIPTS